MLGKLVNWPLLSNPANWIIVCLMVLIAGIMLNTITKQGSVT